MPLRLDAEHSCSGGRDRSELGGFFSVPPGRSEGTERPHGGPGRDTAILVYKVYYDGFKALDLGGSAAQSVVLMVIVVVLTVIQFSYVEKKVNY